MQATPYNHPSAYDVSKRPNQYPWPETVAKFLAMVRQHEEALVRTGTTTHTSDAVACGRNCNKGLIGGLKMLNIKNQPTLAQVQLKFQSHHALRLSEGVVRSLNEPITHCTDEQLDALAKWKALLKNKSGTNLLQRLGEYDAGRSVQEREMEELMKIFAAILFRITRADEMQLEFSWSNLDDGDLGFCYSPNVITRSCRIGMPRTKVDAHVNPTTANAYGFNGRAVDRLSTLLHELVHAYLDLYGCRSCTSNIECVVQLDGHGRAWQLIASAIERATGVYLGFPLSLCRFAAVRNNWACLTRWPTCKDVEEWGLVEG